ncbi:MAG: amidohydrolase family protein [Bacteroidales bacterium]|nr:amidohydrolase family protein [Bacteroidales bacterium]
MRKISANYVFPISGKPIKNGIVCLNSDNVIVDIINPGDSFREVQNLERYSGIITPGFVNAHCHLELSHLKGVVSKDTGMAGFISEIGQFRDSYSADDIQKSIKWADNLMQSRGIVAVGDVVNSTDSISIKKTSQLFYHSFVELFGQNPQLASHIISEGIKIKQSFSDAGLVSSIVPHAPYSVSPELFQEINKVVSNDTISSIHIKESNQEEQLFKDKKGELFSFCKAMYNNVELNIGKTTDSLDYISQFLSTDINLLLVHAVFLTSEKLKQLFNTYNQNKIFVVLCPLSNKYIGNNIFNLDDLLTVTSNICIGTDSLASNTDLSILSEIIELSNVFPEVSLEQLLSFATINGARALNIDSLFGSIEKGKKPGLNLIQGVNLLNFNLSASSKVTPLIKSY